MLKAASFSSASIVTKTVSSTAIAVATAFLGAAAVFASLPFIFPGNKPDLVIESILMNQNTPYTSADQNKLIIVYANTGKAAVTKPFDLRVKISPAPSGNFLSQLAQITGAGSPVFTIAPEEKEGIYAFTVSEGDATVNTLGVPNLNQYQLAPGEKGEIQLFFPFYQTPVPSNSLSITVLIDTNRKIFELNESNNVKQVTDVTPIVIIDVCTDSDNGIDPNMQGVIDVIKGVYSSGVQDGCFSTTTVAEVFCSPSTTFGYDTLSLPCSSGMICSDGACVEKSKVSVSCTDTEIGTSVGVSGTTTVKYADGMETVFADVCKWKGVVTEYSCSGQTLEKTAYPDCTTALGKEGVCQGSKCIIKPPPSPQLLSCTDTEGGENLKSVGIVTKMYSDGTVKTYTDTCGGEEKYVVDYNCGPGFKTTMLCNDKFGAGYICQDGACVEQTP